MKRLVTFAAIMKLFVTPVAVQAQDLPNWFDPYSTELKLKIAIAISPRSPPVRMTLTRSGGARPVIHGTTDLPDGARLEVNFRKPWLPDGPERLSIGISPCGIDCLPPFVNGNWGHAIVKHGAFQDGPFSFDGAPLPPGIYPLEIVLETDNLLPGAEFQHKVLKTQIVIGQDER